MSLKTFFHLYGLQTSRHTYITALLTMAEQELITVAGSFRIEDKCIPYDAKNNFGSQFLESLLYLSSNDEIKVDIDHCMIGNATAPLPVVPQSGEGDLFGALVRRKIVDTSPLYNSVSLFNLSIPKLAEDSLPPDIASVVHAATIPRTFPTRSTPITAATTALEPEENQNERKSETSTSLIVQQRQLRADAIRTALMERHQQQRLQRPYFSTVSKGEFSDVLNGTAFHIGLIQQPNNHATAIPR